MQVLLVACTSVWLAQVARELQKRNALAGLWASDKNRAGILPDKYRRAWPFHLVMKPWYHLASVGPRERIYHALFPFWRAWLRRQPPPAFDVVHAIMGYGTEPFDLADRTGALKVLDASSSHPTSFYGFWQRECDIWCPGATVGLPRWIFARSNRELERADLILCASRFVRDSMLYNGVPEAKCVVNPFGVDTKVFTPRQALPEKPTYVCVGAICLRKGYQYLFRAFAKVKLTFPNAELICVGDYYPDFRNERPRWEGSFTHCHALAHTDLSAVLRRATAFVLPSNEEGFARAIIEAMGAALPIIATHESGATTLVDDGVEGFIVPARNVDRLALAMIQAASDPGRNLRMGRAAYARGATNNSWSDYTDRALKFYAAALENNYDRRKRTLGH